MPTSPTAICTVRPARPCYSAVKTGGISWRNPFSSALIRSLGPKSILLVIVILAGWAPVSAMAQDATNTVATDVGLPNAPGIAPPYSASGDTAADQQPTAIISGTVLDTNGNVIQGARVVLTNRTGLGARVLQSGGNGEFTFTGLQPGIFKLTVTGAGMGTYLAPETDLHAGEMRYVSAVVLPVAGASTVVRVNGDRNELAEEQVQIAIDQRVMGILPNFYSTYDWNAPPMGAKQKFQLAFRSVTDPMAFIGAGVLAGMEQGRGVFPGYGQGVQGYAKRYGATYANDASGRILSSAVFPALFHQDPRYFYKGSGGIPSRALYALGAAFVSRGDNGHWQPNYSHVLGCFAAGGLSNFYYPADSRGVSLTLINGLVSIAGHAGNNLLREFFLRGMTSNVPDYRNGKP